MFSSEKTDLAVVRGDVGDLSQAQAIIVLARAVVLLVAPPGSQITDIAGLKRVTVGVVGGDMNRKVVSALTEEYDLGRANVSFRNLTPAETRRALEAKEVRALLIVVPLAEKYWRCCVASFCRTRRPRRSLSLSMRPAPLRRSSAPTKASIFRKERCGVRLRFPATI